MLMTSHCDALPLTSWRESGTAKWPISLVKLNTAELYKSGDQRKLCTLVGVVITAISAGAWAIATDVAK